MKNINDDELTTVELALKLAKEKPLSRRAFCISVLVPENCSLTTIS